MIKIPTDQGEKTIPEIIDILAYSSYKANRGYGMSHEDLVKHGIGTLEMKERYEWELLNKKYSDHKNAYPQK